MRIGGISLQLHPILQGVFAWSTLTEAFVMWTSWYTFDPTHFWSKLMKNRDSSPSFSDSSPTLLKSSYHSSEP